MCSSFTKSEHDVKVAVNAALESVADNFSAFLNAQSVTDDGRYWLETANEHLRSIISATMEVE